MTRQRTTQENEINEAWDAMNPRERLVHVLYMALPAPTDALADEVGPMCDLFAQGLSEDEVTVCRAMALKHAIETDWEFEDGVPHFEEGPIDPAQAQAARKALGELEVSS